MYNFFVENSNIENNKIIINDNNYNHIKNVLRMKMGENIQICNKETGESYLAEISNILTDIIECKIIKRLTSNEPKQKITVFQGIPKSDKMEYIIQKSVELGVFSIIPTQMKYCVAKINNVEKKMKRWQTISETAAKQSKRNIIPKIENPISFEQLCKKIKEYDLSILAYEKEENSDLKSILKNNKEVCNIAIIIGPEGGIDINEKEKLEKAGVECISLGRRILRTETASTAILSMIMYENEL
ncbi:MAG: 16S rRNA (uracil(1498)-N(3))-methyltransferase [Clostridia bacterium]|nr:16S rRNA (uracil(1498)-N(3))-methyltransferase [Clostridia bacterium]